MKYLSILIWLPLLYLACEKSNQSQLDEVIFVRHQGADMPAYVHGNSSEKVFVIILHGAGSYGLAFRDGIFTKNLEQQYVVVYWDQRGQSMSQGQYASPENIVEFMAEDVKALVDVLQYKYGDDIKLFLLGHSWGGALGATVLLDESVQTKFRGWIKVDGAHDFPYASRARRGLLLQIADEQIAVGNRIDDWQTLRNDVTQLDSLSEEDYSEILQNAKKAIRLLEESHVIPKSGSSEKLRRAILENNPVTWRVSDFFVKPAIQAREMNYSISNRLSQIQIPTLLLWGKYDVSVPPALGYDALNKYGSAEKSLKIFEESIHHPHDTEPELFLKVLVDFIEQYK